MVVADVDRTYMYAAEPVARARRRGRWQGAAGKWLGEEGHEQRPAARERRLQGGREPTAP